MRITAAKVTVREDKDRLKFYEAWGGPVTFREKRDKVDEWIEGIAERAEFDEKEEVLKLFTRARVKTNQNEITGDFISYDIRREVALAVGAPPGQQAPPASRVKVIIVPQKGAGAPGKDEARRDGMGLKPETGLK